MLDDDSYAYIVLRGEDESTSIVLSSDDIFDLQTVLDHDPALYAKFSRLFEAAS